MNIYQFLTDYQKGTNTLLFLGIITWSFFWKGWALWISARNNHKYVFFPLLIVNTIGLLEILYIIYMKLIFKNNKIKINNFFKRNAK